MTTTTMRKGEETLTENIRDLRTQGYSIPEVATRLNVPPTTVKRISGQIGAKVRRAPAPEVHIMLTPEHDARLREMARGMGLVTPMGRRAGEGDLGALLALIASGELTLVKRAR